MSLPLDQWLLHSQPSELLTEYRYFDFPALFVFVSFASGFDLTSSIFEAENWVSVVLFGDNLSMLVLKFN